jgi:hypothetical protein
VTYKFIPSVENTQGMPYNKETFGCEEIFSGLGRFRNLPSGVCAKLIISGVKQ